MKVVTRKVIIEGEEFVLIRDYNELFYSENKTYFGTIPYSELNDEGKMRRSLNGFEMCISSTIQGAMQRRTNKCLTQKFLKENPQINVAEGKGIEEYLNFINTLDYSYED